MSLSPSLVRAGSWTFHGVLIGHRGFDSCEPARRAMASCTHHYRLGPCVLPDHDWSNLLGSVFRAIHGIYATGQYYRWCVIGRCTQLWSSCPLNQPEFMMLS